MLARTKACKACLLVLTNKRRAIIGWPYGGVSLLGRKEVFHFRARLSDSARHPPVERRGHVGCQSSSTNLNASRRCGWPLAKAEKIHDGCSANRTGIPTD